MTDASTWCVPSTRSFDRLLARFAPLFARIAEGAVERETRRILPRDEIAALRDAGFGALRIPVEHGGAGATLPELFALLIELAAAESNIPQALRAHFGAVEDVLHNPNAAHRHKWTRRLADAQLVGSAFSESGANPLGAFSATLTQSAAGLVLNGTKY